MLAVAVQLIRSREDVTVATPRCSVRWDRVRLANIALSSLLRESVAKSRS